ncbi:transposase, partial [Listeria monocytogenes]|nr:transposase [Listeria monocytogenes]
TLRKWISNYKKSGLVGLITKERSDKNSMKISEDLCKIIKHIYLENKNVSITSIYRRTVSWCKENNIQEPSYYQVRKIIQLVPDKLKVLAHQGSKIYMNHYELVHIRETTAPNIIWQADHTLLDIEVLNAKGYPERPWLTIIMDDYSRAITGYFIAFESPNSLRTALTLRQAIWRKDQADWPICGIPRIFYTDHGSDFTSQHLEQVSADLKIELKFSKVGVPRGRGKIERFFHTVNSMLLQDLPGYIKNRKAKSMLTLEEFSDIFRNWLLRIYHQKQHSTTKEKPIAMWNNYDFLPNMPNSLEDLDLLLIKVKKERVVHSDGIHLFGMKYVHPTLSAFVSEPVVIRYDPRDISDVRVFYKNVFLCTAVSTSFEQYAIGIREIEKERSKLKRELKRELIVSTNKVIEKLVGRQKENSSTVKNNVSSLRRYENE